MPKFYVTDKTEEAIIDAPDALTACMKCVRFCFHGIPVNGFYKVSEVGFDEHDEDVVFGSDEVIALLIEMMDEEKKDEEGG